MYCTLEDFLERLDGWMDGWKEDRTKFRVGKKKQDKRESHIKEQ